MLTSPETRCVSASVSSRLCAIFQSSAGEPLPPPATRRWYAAWASSVMR